MNFTDLNGDTIFYRTYGLSYLGASTPLVFLHGLMGSGSNWGKAYTYFSTKRPVLVFDQRGHGRSKKPLEGYSPQDYGEDLRSLLDHLNWEKVHLVGHSMGGRNAMAFAYHYPQRLASLVLEDSGSEGCLDRLPWIKGLLEKIPTPFFDRESARKFFEESFKKDRFLGDFLFSNIIYQGKHYDWRFFSKGIQESIRLGRARDYNREFSTLSLPTLLIRGEQSNELTQEEAEHMCGLRKGVSLAVVKGAGHFIHFTHWRQFNQLVENFITPLG